MLKDQFGRTITYLRISVTDRCNLRCVYCMPPEGITWQPHETILSFEEIVQIVKVAAANGIRQIRLTGGEPLVRKDLPGLVRLLAAIPGIEDISLTTNGLLLEKMAVPLYEAGVHRINVSLDTLNPEKFARITRGGSLETVLRGLEAAEAAGLAPIKLNTVVMRGVNEDELPDLARLSFTHPWHIRFIELMPIRNQAPWGACFPNPGQAYFPIQQMLDLLVPLGFQPVTRSIGNGPAQEYQVPGAPGRVGIISAVGEKFCETCNRLRLTADGSLRPCLVSEHEISLRDALRSGQPLLPLFLKAVAEKPSGHDMADVTYQAGRCMMQIGG